MDSCFPTIFTHNDVSLSWTYKSVHDSQAPKWCSKSYPVARQIWYHQGFTHPGWWFHPNKYHKFPEWSGRLWRHLCPWTQGTLSTFDEDLRHFRVWYGPGPKDVGWWIAKKDATTAVHLSGLTQGLFWFLVLVALRNTNPFGQTQNVGFHRSLQ